ncbi:MAG: hypothetical protein C0490_22635 [Marivirga sp.]|nr:hypothetical protein [Marivirga sp.]
MIRDHSLAGTQWKQAKFSTSMTLIFRYIYQAIRYSAIYPLYLKLFRISIYREYQKEKYFYKSIIKDPAAIVFDIGANVGDKSLLFSKYSQLVIALEPDIDNFRLLLRRFLSNSKIRVINSAVGNKIGKEVFYVSLPGSPANTLSAKWKGILEDASANRWSKSLEFSNTYEVEVTTLDSLIARYGSPYFIKIDVEGYEKLVLEGLTKTIPIISLEANFPDFRDETISCIKQIKLISNNTSFNVVDDKLDFFWPENRGYDFMNDWLCRTELKYFEIFCFSR